MSSKAAMPEHCHYASMRDSRQQGLAAAPSRQVKVRRMRSPCNPPHLCRRALVKDVAMGMDQMEKAVSSSSSCGAVHRGWGKGVGNGRATHLG